MVKTLSKAEMVEILEDLARNGSDSARIQAIRQLIALEEDKPEASRGFREAG